MNIAQVVRIRFGFRGRKQASTLRVGGKHRVDEICVAGWCFLRHSADAPVRRYPHFADIRVELPEDKAQ